MQLDAMQKATNSSATVVITRGSESLRAKRIPTKTARFFVH
jgi:hypothetical protein